MSGKLQKEDNTGNNAAAVNPKVVVKMLFFLELINAGSITNAAEALGVAKSTGSRWLSELETELGMTLYQRNNPNQRLTEAGELLYNKLLDVNANISLIIKELSQFATHTVGKVKVCCPPITFHTDEVVLTLINGFILKNPLVDIQLLVTPRVIDQCQEHDLVISTVVGSKEHPDIGLPLMHSNLLTDKFVTVASPDYLKEFGEPLVPADLAVHRCLYSKSLVDQNEWLYKKAGKEVSAKLAKKLELSDVNMQLTAAVNSMGISYLPEFIVQPFISQGALVTLLDEYETDDWNLNIYYKAQKYMTHCANELKEYFIENHGLVMDNFMDEREKRFSYSESINKVSHPLHSELK